MTRSSDEARQHSQVEPDPEHSAEDPYVGRELGGYRLARRIGFGGMVTFASYNSPKHNFLRDAWLVPLINASTSILGGFVVFAVLGHLSYVQESGKGIDSKK